MARPHEIVLLNTGDKEKLEALTSKGKISARTLKRAEILLRGDDGYTVDQIAELTEKHPQTVRNVRRRHIEEDLDVALNERPRPGKPRKLFDKDIALIATIACSEPPSGRSSWTLRLIADKFVELSEQDSIGKETVRRAIKKTSSSPGRRSSGVDNI